jgi:hypothetical protein
VVAQVHRRWALAGNEQYWQQVQKEFEEAERRSVYEAQRKRAIKDGTWTVTPHKRRRGTAIDHS